MDQEDEYPFLKPEKEVIRRAIDNGMPYLGFCLGHQLLAGALGLRVGPNMCRSAGFLHRQITKNGRRHPFLRDIPRSFSLFKWRSQVTVPPLPKHVQALVTSADCEIEAISIDGRPHLVGLQFDNPAASLSDVKRWVESEHEWLSRMPGLGTAAMLTGAEKLVRELCRHFAVMLGNYIALIGGKLRY